MQAFTVRHVEPTDIVGIHALYSEQLAMENTLQMPFQPLGACPRIAIVARASLFESDFSMD
ncbi:MAG: hypothetical protein COW84_02385 [Gammaproteobacteria bacterium CG22_combo_CG10-13_8_21_14_all_40_8]|nr:MAG: hypothetical protein COW84_02385 [Gammaproteobacteria bacterium CG22_combo_CG10-13_8_21_14_all_40_8]